MIFLPAGVQFLILLAEVRGFSHLYALTVNISIKDLFYVYLHTFFVN